MERFVRPHDAGRHSACAASSFCELFEILTLQQTRKAPPMPIVLLGRDYWRRIVDFNGLVEDGMIAAEDLKLLAFVDDPEEGWEAMLRHGLKAHTPETSGKRNEGTLSIHGPMQAEPG